MGSVTHDVGTNGADDAPYMRRCSRCGKHFRNRQAASDHIRMVHKGNGHRVSARMEDRPGYEPSLGDEVVEIQQKLWAREPLTDYERVVAQMFDLSSTLPGD